MPFRPDPSLQTQSRAPMNPQGQAPRMPMPSGPGFIEKNAPIAGNVAGGFLGPIGSGAGYSIGKSLQAILGQLRPLGSEGGDREYGTGLERVMSDPKSGQRLAENLLNYITSLGPQVNLPGQEPKPMPENVRQVTEFGKDVTGGALTAGTVDYLTGKGTSAVLEKGLPKILGPLAKVKGIRPSTIKESAEEVASNAWSKIGPTIEKATTQGKKIDITGLINKLEDFKTSKLKGIKGTSKDAKEIMKGVQTVLDTLKQESKSAVSSIGKEGAESYTLSPQGAQTLKEIFGQQTFSPTTGLAKMFGGLKPNSQQQARKIAGGTLRKQVIDMLEGQGVKDAASLYNEYAKASKLAGLASDPYNLITSKAFLPSILGLASGGVLPGSLLYGVATPYGQQVLREGAKLPFKLTPAIERLLVGGMLENDGGNTNE